MAEPYQKLFLDLLGSGIPFSKDAGLRARFCKSAADLAQELATRGIELPAARLENLARKLAVYTAKQGWQNLLGLVQLDAHAPTLADAIGEDITALDKDVSLKALLKKHRQNTLRAAAELTRRIHKGEEESPPPKKLFDCGADNGYALYELETPDHLIEASKALGICVGTLYNEEALDAKGLSRTDPRAKYHLVYAAKLRRKESRLFQLRDAQGKICAVMEYKPATGSIIQIEGEQPPQALIPVKLRGNEDFFPALCDALYTLNGIMPVNAISDLQPPQYMRGGIWNLKPLLTRNGWKSWNEIREGDVFIERDPSRKETIELENFVGLKESVAVLAQNPKIILDVRRLEDSAFEDLPTHVKAGIICRAKGPWKLEEAGDITLEWRGRFVFPHLRKVGSITGVETHAGLECPELEECGTIYFPGNYVRLGKLRRGIDLLLHRIKELTCPALEEIVEIQAGNASVVDLSALKKCVDLSTGNTDTLVLSQVTELNNLSSGAMKIEAPLLEKIEFLSAEYAHTLILPRVKSVNHLDAPLVFEGDLSSLEACKYPQGLRRFGMKLPPNVRWGSYRPD